MSENANEEIEPAIYDLKVALPNLPEGEPVQIPGLGTFKNGSTYEITQSDDDAYRSYHTKALPNWDEEAKEYRGSKEVLGPSLLDASVGMRGIDVSARDGSQPELPLNDPDNNSETTEVDDPEGSDE